MNWGGDHFMMIPHMMGSSIASGSHMMPGPNMGTPALLPTPMQPPAPAPDGMMQPLAPPRFMMNEWTQANILSGSAPKADNFISSEKPDVDLTKENNDDDNTGKNSRDKDQRDGKRDLDDRDRGRRPRSPFYRRENRDKSRRERRPRWSDNMDIESDKHMVMSNNMMVPGNNMMPFGNNIMMGQQQIDMGNLPNMPNMVPNMPNMIHGMNMMTNMMPGMMANIANVSMDQNMLMMQMNLNNNQPIGISSGLLLPPLPNDVTPTRRERPPGCRTIFVGGLPHGVGEDTIREIFERFGVVTNVKLHRQGVTHVRFGSQEMVEQSFLFSGYRYRRHEQSDNEATTLFIDYALNREDQVEYDRGKRNRSPTPLRIEPYSAAAFTAITEKIKSDTEFSDAAPTLAGWLERGECIKKNANAFYSLIQASNNQIRRLYSEKMAIDEEFQNLKATLRDRFASVITQFEQVGKILTAAKMQRVSDHFSKQQRRNIEMWLKMTEDVENIKEEFNVMFDEEETDEKNVKSSTIVKKYGELKVDYDNLQFELEGYKNEAHLAKDEAERKFEKFKAHFIAQQALQNKQPVYPPLPTPPPLPVDPPLATKPTPPPQTPISPSEAKLISVLTAFLLVHPLGASLDYLVSYVKSIIPTATQSVVHNILQKYKEVFARQTSGVGANFETRWTFITYDVIKKEVIE